MRERRGWWGRGVPPVLFRPKRGFRVDSPRLRLRTRVATAAGEGDRMRSLLTGEGGSGTGGIATVTAATTGAAGSEAAAATNGEEAPPPAETTTDASPRPTSTTCSARQEDESVWDNERDNRAISHITASAPSSVSVGIFLLTWAVEGALGCEGGRGRDPRGPHELGAVQVLRGGRVGGGVVVKLCTEVT